MRKLHWLLATFFLVLILIAVAPVLGGGVRLYLPGISSAPKCSAGEVCGNAFDTWDTIPEKAGAWYRDASLQTWKIVSSLEARRFYGAVIGVGTLALSFFVAYKQFEFLRDLDDPIEFVEKRLREKRVRVGGVAISEAAVQRKLKRIQDAKNQIFVEVLVRLALLICFGYFVPFAVMTAGAHWYGVIFPGEAPFLDTKSMDPLFSPSLKTSLHYVFDQLSRGAAFDYMEVYNIPGFTDVTGNPDALLVRPISLLFRTLTGSFSGVILIFIVRVSWAWLKPKLPPFLVPAE